MSKRPFTGGYGITAVSSETNTISTSRTRQRILFPYLGGKSLLVPKLTRIIEDAAWRFGLSHYVEPTVGSGQVGLNIKQGLFNHYHFNDNDQAIVNLFKILGDPYQIHDLIGLLLQLGVGEEVFEQAKKSLSPKNEVYLTELENAAFAYITIMQSRAAGRKSFNSEYSRRFKKVEKYYQRVQELESFHPFLSQVEVTCRDVVEILKESLWDSYALYYIDPPYSPDSEMSGTNHYKNNWNKKKHEEYVDLLVQSHAKIIVSGYDNPAYQRLQDDGWSKILLRNVPVPSSAGASPSGAGVKRVDEYIWTSFELPDYLMATL
jgi:DNA adenine methylase